MTTSSIRKKAAQAYREGGCQPPPNGKKYTSKDRRVWITKMYELEQREMVQDDYQ